MTYFDPSEYIKGIQQLLISDKKKIGFLCGAGTSLAKKNNNSKVVPAVGQLTIAILNELKVDPKYEIALDEIEIEIKEKYGDKRFNIETLLSNIEEKKEIIGGKSVGEFAACFLLGYFVLSVEEIQERLEKYCIPLGISWVILIITRCGMYQMGMSNGLIWDVEQRILSWVGILAIVALGKHFLEFNNAFTKYFTPAAFPIYFFHQSIVVIMGYIIVRHVHGTSIQYVCIVAISFVLTIFMYEICRRIVITRFLFGIKKR